MVALSVFQLSLLSTLILAVLILPLALHKIEQNLEAFLFVCGIIAVTVSHEWSFSLLKASLTDPIKITLAVLIAGFLFKKFHKLIQLATHQTLQMLGFKGTLAAVVLCLSLTSSLITAIIAALILAEIVPLLPLDRKGRVRLVVYSCYAIGMGAVLTAIGEPLGTIVLSKLKGAPHFAGFWFLVNHLGWYVLLGAIAMAALATRIPLVQNASSADETAADPQDHSLKSIFLRAGKVYLFVMALVLLGEGLKPLAEMTISKLSSGFLYFINMLSAILDNATLAAIEITPDITMRNLMFLLMSLIIAGGMLIPGNIPNIICASKLKITSKEWAKEAFPLGIGLLIIYFIVLSVIL